MTDHAGRSPRAAIPEFSAPGAAIGEPFGPRPFIGHVTRVAAGESIVNPDGLLTEA